MAARENKIKGLGLHDIMYDVLNTVQVRFDFLTVCIVLIQSTVGYCLPLFMSSVYETFWEPMARAKRDSWRTAEPLKLIEMISDFGKTRGRGAEESL